MTIRTIQLGTPRIRDEGLRIGTVRFLPRGVRKDQYAELDYFDVWLPILAPSREILQARKANSMSVETFARRYRSEMKKTDARQVIQMLARTAAQTNLSVGCYCPDERHCHRSVLIRLIQDAADQPVVEWPGYSAFSVYTIVHRDTLQQALKEDAPRTFSVNQPWVTALSLMQEARHNGEMMPILFGDAVDCSQLLCHGILDDIKITDNSTEYRFRDLRRLGGGHSPQDLRLRSSGEFIAPGFIRPYAICHTPEFIPGPGK